MGRATADSFGFPITQEEFGDALGLSVVHTNRSLQYLRQEGLITLAGGVMTVLDVDRLREFAGFKANYLHLTLLSNDGPGMAD